MFKKMARLAMLFLGILFCLSIYVESSDILQYAGYLDSNNVSKTHSIVLTNDGALGLNIAFDSTLTIYNIQILDTNGVCVASKYDPASGINNGPYGLKTGTYSINITRSFYAGGYGNYMLTTTYDAQTLGNDTEPNNQVSDAKNAPSTGSVTGHLGYIGGGNGTQDTIDIYYVILTNDGALGLNIAFDSTLTIYNIQILDTNGVCVASKYDPASGINNGPYGLKAGTYYIIITRSSYLGGYGGYSLNTMFNAQLLGIDTEPNDQVSDAKYAPSTGSVTGHLGYIGGGNGTQDIIDIYKVILTYNCALSLNITFDSTLEINYIQILDTQGTSVASKYSPVSGVNFGPYGLNNGTYYIKIAQSSYLGGYGGYTLTTITTGIPTISLSRTSINFGAEQNGAVTPAATSRVSNIGSGTLTWAATRSADWISITPTSGVNAGLLAIGIARTNLPPGTYQGTVTVSDPTATNSPQVITVSYQVYESGTNNLPFGQFDTPIDQATVSSSIPVTGWALDNIGFQSVKIYRGASLSDRAYIGDAMFVEGARPDVEAAYPGHPEKFKAGWGYMMLTNFLPLGDGPYTLLAFAVDLEGNEVLLGQKMITVANATAIRPFGAIDTPTQGGSASGNPYYNFGWALTPQPNSIPVNGSTLNVWVDGIPLGHPSYNHYRADIASLFPGYANANAAIGVYNLETTAYADGVHTIVWSVQDSGGNVDGIGSRYFTIQNTGTPTAPLSGAGPETVRSFEEIEQMPEDVWTPVYVRRGVELDIRPEMVVPEKDGSVWIQIPEVTQVAVFLNENHSMETMEKMGYPREQILDKTRSEHARYEAYALVHGEVRNLPIGTTFDSQDGVFYWQPGPGFLGEFHFIIIDSETTRRKTLVISITPRS